MREVYIKMNSGLRYNFLVLVIMGDEISVPLSVHLLDHRREIALSTGEIVSIAHDLKTKRYVNDIYLGPEDELFHVPLKPGDKYYT